MKFYFIPLKFQTIQFINEDLKGELLHNKKSEEEINNLMETGPDDKRRIEQLVTATKATEKALKIVSDISINPLLIEHPVVI